MNILLVEDELSLARAVKRILEGQGYLVDAVHDGLSAVDYATGFSYDLIILDVMLPKLDGFEVVRILRKDNVNTPILMLTARTTVRDKVNGLNRGADDYMTKPFDTEELLARVGALTRRTGGTVVVDTVSYGDLTLDVKAMLLTCGGSDVQLSKKEFEVLKLFFYNPTMTITKEMIINKVWGAESDVSDNNVEVYISFLRKKLRYLKSTVTLKTSRSSATGWRWRHETLSTPLHPVQHAVRVVHSARHLRHTQRCHLAQPVQRSAAHHASGPAAGGHAAGRRQARPQFRQRHRHRPTARAARHTRRRRPPQGAAL